MTPNGEPNKFRKRHGTIGRFDNYDGAELVRARMRLLDYSGDDSDESGGGISGDLISSLVSNASSAYQTTVLASAPPATVAAITGNTLSTGLTSSAGLFLLFGAIVVAFFAFRNQ